MFYSFYAKPAEGSRTHRITKWHILSHISSVCVTHDYVQYVCAHRSEKIYILYIDSHMCLCICMFVCVCVEEPLLGDYSYVHIFLNTGRFPEMRKTKQMMTPAYTCSSSIHCWALWVPLNASLELNGTEVWKMSTSKRVKTSANLKIMTGMQGC